MTETTTQFKSLFMVALLVFSVFGGLALTGGTALAAENDRAATANASGTFDTRTGSGYVLDGATVFQGESAQFSQNVTAGGFNSDTLTGTSGDAEGIPLSFDIPRDQQVGQYADTAATQNAVTVLEPRVDTVEFYNENDAEVTSGEISQNEEMTLAVGWNFEEAEDIELTVEQNGVDVTQEVLQSGTAIQQESDINSGGEYDGLVTYTLSFADSDSGEYTVTVEGVDDLDFGDATQERTLNVGVSQDTTLTVDENEPTQGENVRFEIADSTVGATHFVTVDADDFENPGAITPDVFRSVGEVIDTGVSTSGEFAYAEVEIDDESSVGIGEVETEYLDTGTLDLRVYPSETSVADIEAVNNADDDSDKVQIRVTDGTVTLDSPSGDYTIGDEVQLTGSTSEDIDEVVFYARNNGNWELMEINDDYVHVVDSDNTFDIDDVRLTDGAGPGNDIFSLPGSYVIGVVQASAVEDTTTTSGYMDSIETTTFTDKAYDYNALTSVDSQLSASLTTVNGEVTEANPTVDFEGEVKGQDEIVIALVDERGNTVSQTVTVESDGTFLEEDVSVDGFTQGNVETMVLSAARDNTYGDGLPSEYDNSASGLQTYINDLGDRSLTQEAVVESIASETYEDTATDDIVVTESFRLTDERINIDSISSPVESGTDLTISGTTNVDSETEIIDVTFSGDNIDSFQFQILDDWDQSGNWSVTSQVPSDIEDGEYTVEADTGTTSDIETFTVGTSNNEELENPEEEPVEEEPVEEEPVEEEPVEEEPVEEEPEDQSTDDSEQSTEDTNDNMDDSSTESTDESTEESTPGFGALVAVVALIGAALLAKRRNN